MHDLDRTFMEYEDESESESESFEFSGENEWGEVLGETEVQELAAELLSVASEQELNQFLGDFIKKTAGTLGSIVKSPIGQALGGALKTVARQALPMAGAALGNMVVPGVGGMIGGKLASAAGSMFGLELEGMSQEDREFEVAKQFVRLAGDATSTAVRAPQDGKSPQQIAKDAVLQAAQKFAPGLLQPAQPQGSLSSRPSGGGARQQGRWVRRGNRILLLGV